MFDLENYNNMYGHAAVHYVNVQLIKKKKKREKR